MYLQTFPILVVTHTVHTFVKVVPVPATSRLVGRSRNHLLASVCLTSWEFPTKVTFSLPWLCLLMWCLIRPKAMEHPVCTLVNHLLSSLYFYAKCSVADPDPDSEKTGPGSLVLKQTPVNLFVSVYIILSKIQFRQNYLLSVILSVIRCLNLVRKWQENIVWSKLKRHISK